MSDGPGTFRRSDGTEVTHTLRSAVVLLTRALEHIDLVQPESLRPVIRLMLSAAIEKCAVSRGLWGLPLGYDIELAQRLIEAAESSGGDDVR